MDLRDFKIIKSTFNNKKRTLFYWLFNVENDSPDLNSYVNLSKQNITSSIFTLISEIYKNYSNIVETKLLNYIDTFKELNNYQIENIMKKYNQYINQNFDKRVKNSGLNYSLLKKLLDKKVIEDNIDNIIPGKSGNIIKLPKLEITRDVDNIIAVNKKEDTDIVEINNEIEPICHHYIKWKEINKLAKQKNDIFSQSVFNFVKKYVRENENGDYICKSCSEVLNLKKYVFEGTYVPELDTFLTTSLAVSQDLKKFQSMLNIIELLEI